MIRVETRCDGAIEHIWLDRPKANVLDRAMVSALRAHLRTVRRPGLKLLVFEGTGAHFSFGASVPEHLPGMVGDMLPEFHQLFRELEGVGVPTAAVVRGQCLGGGFELALACGRVFCDSTARFAVPEVKLGVFPPVAAVLLPLRTGSVRSMELIVTGRTLTGADALACGVADELSEDPRRALDAWYDAHLAPLSAVAVSYAWRASRRSVVRALDGELSELERLYLDELMLRADPVEGIEAFVARRAPIWRNE